MNATRGITDITNKDELAHALRDAAEIEQQLMCEYLYAAFSLKREPDSGCTAGQAEIVRRWCSTIYFVARQEMEHLSLVNSMLTAIGARPWFLRPDFGPHGLVSPYFTASARLALAGAGRQPVELPYTLERFDRATIERFVCGESPPADDVPPGMDPYWCFAEGQSGEAPSRPLGTSHLAAARDEISAGTVQDLYTAIEDAFRTLDGLFVPNPPEVTIPVEYNVFVFPVTDRSSALAAIDLILRQGEGLHGQWTYESHFRHFFLMRQELVALQAADPNFDPALPLLENPQPTDVTDDLARAVFDVAGEAYVTLLYMLTGLYARFVPSDDYPHFSTALAQMAFAPTMTMIVRSLAEVLVQLPIASDERSDVRTGPSFAIPDEDRTLLADAGSARLGDIGFYLDRWDHLTAGIDRLQVMTADAGSPVAEDLRFIYQNSFRITANLRRIYQAGYYPKFVNI